MELAVQNLTGVVSSFNPGAIDYNAFHALFPGESPQIITIGEPGAPIIVKFNRAGFEIVYADERIQVTAQAPPEAKASREFPGLASKALRAMGNQPLKAFGFNFDFNRPEFRIEPVLQCSRDFTLNSNFTFVGITGARLVFRKSDDVLYTLDLASQRSHRNVHVNVHHERQISTHELTEQLPGLYGEGFRTSVQLVEEVFRDASVSTQ